jgi:hypothetical protein
LSYETRVLAFADMLGFSKLVLKSPTDEQAMIRVDAVMNLLRKIEQENYELIQNHMEEIQNHMEEMSFFSDCVVLSGSIDRSWYILREIGKLAREALTVGVPCRGGVATDDCYHRRGLVVGPTMVKAYCMEQAAEYPRIVLDDRTVENWNAYIKDEINPSAASDAVRRDKDGRWYINIFHHHFEGGLPWSSPPRSQTEFFNIVREKIGIGLQHSCPKIQSKYAWLNEELNRNN